MTRQIALGAVVAFAVTVLALSVWEPKAPAVVNPTPPPALAPGMAKPFRAATLKPDTLSRSIRNPSVAVQPLNLAPMAVAVDAGAPSP